MSINQQHHLVISPIKYPGGLRIVECETCSYAFATETDLQGIIKMETKESINQGDAYASHTLFQTPKIKLALNFGMDMEADEEQIHFGEI
ncbi:MAG: hypothetical protein GY805_38680 [Chloroflexi bacterium]|nr:hypothetical protein [Chloroflexota bacterium]